MLKSTHKNYGPLWRALRRSFGKLISNVVPSEGALGPWREKFELGANEALIVRKAPDHYQSYVLHISNFHS